jgi:hypothetical protein
MATARHHQAGRTRGGARPVGHRLGAVPRGRDGRMRHGACPDRLVQAARAARSTSRSPVARPSIRGQGKGVPRWSWLHSPIGIAPPRSQTAISPRNTSPTPNGNWSPDSNEAGANFADEPARWKPTMPATWQRSNVPNRPVEDGHDQTATPSARAGPPGCPGPNRSPQSYGPSPV